MASESTSQAADVAIDSSIRLSLTFEEITFSSGEILNFEDDDIVVFVGPNNAGKSLALQELRDFVSNKKRARVIRNVKFKRSSTSDRTGEYLKSKSQRIQENGQIKYVGLGFSFSEAQVNNFDFNSMNSGVFYNFFCKYIGAENRIIGSDSVESIPLYTSPPQHPIHVLLMDEYLAGRFSKLFRRAFDADLFPFRAAGRQIPLHVGRKPVPPVGEDELGQSFVEELLATTVPLQQQGDGMRSFATIMLHALVADHHSIQLLDEPEAFLHPPQARLIGEFIAKERQSKSQLFIATHSSDILDGLLTGGAARIRIVRIQRENSVNRVKELSKDKTAKIASDTLTRYSRVFEGIFYNHVFICESDADCLFYQSILETKKVSGDRRADVLFIHSAGKHRMAHLAETLCNLDVPVSVIADIDLLKEWETFQKLFGTLGGDCIEVKPHYAAIAQSIEERRPPLGLSQIKEQICSILHNTSDEGKSARKLEKEINKIFRAASPWDDVKRAGRPALSPGQAISHFDELVKKCADVGLHIVPVGQLEGFCRAIEGHGPGFVAKLLETRQLEDDHELEEARQFMAKIWSRARKMSISVNYAPVAVPAPSDEGGSDSGGGDDGGWR